MTVGPPFSACSTGWSSSSSCWPSTPPSRGQQSRPSYPSSPWLTTNDKSPRHRCSLCDIVLFAEHLYNTIYTIIICDVILISLYIIITVWIFILFKRFKKLSTVVYPNKLNKFTTNGSFWFIDYECLIFIPFPQGFLNDGSHGGI